MTAIELIGLTERYLSMLSQEGIPDPLSERLTVAAVLADLLSLADSPIPDTIEDWLHNEPAA